MLKWEYGRGGGGSGSCPDEVAGDDDSEALPVPL